MSHFGQNLGRKGLTDVTQILWLSSYDSHHLRYIRSNLHLRLCRPFTPDLIKLISFTNTFLRIVIGSIHPYELYELYDWGKFRNFMEL